MTGEAKRTFHDQLVLNRWMFRFFRADGLKELKDGLDGEPLEGIGQDGHTRFFHALANNRVQEERLPRHDLARYDLRIALHWQRITERRNRVEGTELRLKPFQYLSLLFTEIYLDWYVRRRKELLDELNGALAVYNEGRREEDRFSAYEADDLNKIAFWNATGSGKTLLLHINILQYLHYLQLDGAAGRRFPDKIILLTPSEGLSDQHLRELRLSGLMGGRFDKHKASLPGTVEVIDINKLGDKMGDKTVAVDAFEGWNLVLVDEGHRGAGTADGAWMARREALCRGGFSFEYSATFGQAVGKGPTVGKAEEEALKKKARIRFGSARLNRLDEEQLAQIALDAEERRGARLHGTREGYAKCMLFDYSYKFFYEDGYGKESLILNLAEDDDPQRRQLYLTACLLAFYQQQYLWRRNREALARYHLEKPLWVFVGNKVTDEDSDLQAVLAFLASFVNEAERSQRWLRELLQDRAMLLDGRGRNWFEGRFAPLMGQDPAALYRDILRTLFNAGARQRLKLVNLRGVKGELALRLGGGTPFGVLNIGEDSRFWSQCEGREDLDVERDDFGGSLFDAINDPGSEVHLLIGSRKFAEGWSSWRVSTMGLLHMGRGEGTQIIQLFGRGVRLKGFGYSLKRTPPDRRPPGLHLDKLETLNIFGVRADYMAQFKEYLREEGVTPSDEWLELELPIRLIEPAHTLLTLRLREGEAAGFDRDVQPDMFDVPEAFVGRIKPPRVLLDLYPRVEALRSEVEAESSDGLRPRGGSSLAGSGDDKQEGKLPAEAVAAFDYDRIYLALQEEKRRRGWSNLGLSREKLRAFCLMRNDWYTLYAPEAERSVRRFADVRRLEDVLLRLLLDYAGRYYRTLKSAYEGQCYEVAPLTLRSAGAWSERGRADTEERDDCRTHADADAGEGLRLEGMGTIPDRYRFRIEPTDEGRAYAERLQELGRWMAQGEEEAIRKWQASQVEVISFERHLYGPLLYVADKSRVPFRMNPLLLEAPGEAKFVRDLAGWMRSAEGQSALAGQSLYLLRNPDSRGKGLSFARAGNFNPDFLLWLVDDRTGEQRLSLLDLKGIRSLSPDDPKFGLYEEVRGFEPSGPKLRLSAFILSDTRHIDLVNVRRHGTVEQPEQRNILFLDDPGYLGKLVRAMLR